MAAISIRGRFIEKDKLEARSALRLELPFIMTDIQNERNNSLRWKFMSRAMSR